MIIMSAKLKESLIHTYCKSSRDLDYEQQGPLLTRPGAAKKLMTVGWRVLYALLSKLLATNCYSSVCHQKSSNMKWTVKNISML